MNKRKLILCLCILLCFFCKQKENKKNIIKSSNLIDSVIDTKIRYKNQELDNIDDVLVQLNKARIDKYGDSPLTLVNEIILLDKKKAFIFEENSAICNREYLCVYNEVNKKIEYILIIKEVCDTELSFHEYKELKYFFIDNIGFDLCEFSEKVIDSNLVDKKGWLKQELTREDVEIKRDSIKFEFKFENLNSNLIKYPYVNSIDNIR